MNPSCGCTVGKFQFFICLAAFFLVCKGVVNSRVMDFDLIAFSLAPSTEQFNRCRKDNLLKIAFFLVFFLNVVPHNASKKEVKKLLQEELVMQRMSRG